MSSPVFANAHTFVNARKRPNHPSPVPSYRTTPVHDRHGHHAVLKRARWDVSSPTPSLPAVSMPAQPQQQPAQPFAFASSSSAFRFGFAAGPTSTGGSGCSNYSHSNHRSKRQRATHASHSHKAFLDGKDHSGSAEPMIVNDDDDSSLTSDPNASALAFERLRRSTFDEAELFVTRMREWEARSSSSASLLSSSTSHHHHRQHSHPHPPHRASPPSGDASSSSPPYMSMSNSITSTTSSSGSGSGSDAAAASPFLFSATTKPPVFNRKRSWSIVEDEDEERMEWEVVASASGTTGVDIPKVASSSAKKFDDADMAMESTSAHGDDEKEDDDDIPDSEDDDDLIFVIGDNSATDAAAAGLIDEPKRQHQQPVATERMLSELSQVLAAGAAGLDDYVEVGASAAPVGGTADSDAGALWR